jgi:hypothetical protein
MRSLETELSGQKRHCHESPNVRAKVVAR